MAIRQERVADMKIPWSEIQQHNKEDDYWLVVEGKAYDVTRWAERHPGGRRLLSLHAGRDATVCFMLLFIDRFNPSDR